jgi:suppressor for copper-sensitivity B
MPPRIDRGVALVCLVLLVLGAGAARAAGTYLTAPPFAPAGAGLAEPGASAWDATDQTRVRLVSAVAAVGSAEELRLGLEFRLAPGWKIYWRSPGAAGFPPQLDWSGSENLAKAEPAWPAPTRFVVLGLSTVGYHDVVVLPLAVRPIKAGAPLKLVLKVDYLTCREICIPYTAHLALDVPAGPAAATEFTQLIDRFMAQVPGDGRAAGLAIARAAVTGSADRPALEVVATAREPFAKPDLFVEGPSQLDFAVPAVSFANGGRTALLRLAVGTVAKEFPDWRATPLTLTLVDGARALTTRLTPEAEPPRADWARLVAMLGLALLGGLILNLMPCVLPVLSLKLMGIIGHGGAERRTIRVSFLASAAGVLCAFLALAVAAIAVKSAGGAVGWGIQFQEPAFLTALALVCAFFAANLWGLFEVRLPGFLADALARGGHGSGILGEFLTGAFATILATPCSAPFVGTALGFALARGAPAILAIFAALGVGLALPYLAVAAAPGLAQRLPRPGRWMIALKAILGVALAATALWLVSIMTVQLGLKAVLAVGSSAAGIPLVLWARRQWPTYTRYSSLVGLVVLVVLAFVLPSRLERGWSGIESTDKGDWQTFERKAIPSLVAQGKLVFVDVTADWCITCKANRTLVLDRPPVSVLLARPGVVRMLADWTRPSDEIASYLTSFGRYGIPFNVVYGPGAPAGVPLPELLTAEAVRAAFDQAAAVKGAAAVVEGAKQ